VLPERPAPLNIPKIANANIVSSRGGGSVNNLVIGRPVAGHVFLPALGVAAWVKCG
jgi:hypothetical protein